MRKVLFILLLLTPGLTAAGDYTRPPRPSGVGYHALKIASFPALFDSDRDTFLFVPPVPLPTPVPVQAGVQPAVQWQDVIDGPLPRTVAIRPPAGGLGLAQDLQSCARCHSAETKPKPRGGVVLFEGGALKLNVKWKDVSDAVASDSMPPDPAPKLGADAKARIMAKADQESK